MEYVILGLFFIYGIVLGSFFNVVGLRVPKKQSIALPPSSCTTCNRKLEIFDLIPVFSYLFLKGKCRGCGSKISFIYPFMEFMTGILFALSYYILGFSPELVVAILFISMLVIITVSDIAYMLIPKRILLPFAIALLHCKAIVAARALVGQPIRCSRRVWCSLSHCSRVERRHGWRGHQIVFRH